MKQLSSDMKQQVAQGHGTWYKQSNTIFQFLPRGSFWTTVREGEIQKDPSSPA